MINLINEKRPVARKDHNCDSCRWLMEHGGFDVTDFTISERKSFVRARRQEFKIKKGQTYIRQFCEYAGDVYTWKAIPEVHEICLKHNVFEL